MKKSFLSILVTLLLALGAYKGYEYFKNNRSPSKLKSELQNGDIIFHTSITNQSLAIQLATKSKYSHVGIIYIIDGQHFVYEAVQPVKLTPLNVWIKRGKNNKYVVKRLKNAESILDSNTLQEMQSIGNVFKGLNYDKYFEWSDDKIYCSELVWKIYKRATGIEIGSLQELSEFDLTSEIVRSKMAERYGENIPMNEKVISPAAMFESNELVTVLSN